MDHIIIPACNLQAIMDSGQCFRMEKDSDDKFIIPAGQCLAKGEQYGTHAIIRPESGSEEFWKDYFDCQTDYGYIASVFKSAMKSDFVDKAVDFSEGLRMLNQDPFETLISFIISQRKNITAIRTSVRQICNEWGKDMSLGIKSFPTVQQLAGKNFSQVFSLGYRRAYVEDAVRWCLVNDLDSLRHTSYESALRTLKEIQGVGDKVANCVLLYSLGFKNAFPIDIWVERIIQEDFGGSFPVTPVAGARGILQLYMYYYKRCS